MGIIDDIKSKLGQKNMSYPRATEVVKRKMDIEDYNQKAKLERARYGYESARRRREKVSGGGGSMFSIGSMVGDKTSSLGGGVSGFSAVGSAPMRVPSAVGFDSPVRRNVSRHRRRSSRGRSIVIRI